MFEVWQKRCWACWHPESWPRSQSDTSHPVGLHLLCSFPVTMVTVDPHLLCSFPVTTVTVDPRLLRWFSGTTQPCSPVHPVLSLTCFQLDLVSACSLSGPCAGFPPVEPRQRPRLLLHSCRSELGYRDGDRCVVSCHQCVAGGSCSSSPVTPGDYLIPVPTQRPSRAPEQPSCLEQNVRLDSGAGGRFISSPFLRGEGFHVGSSLLVGGPQLNLGLVSPKPRPVFFFSF